MPESFPYSKGCTGLVDTGCRQERSPQQFDPDALESLSVLGWSFGHAKYLSCTPKLAAKALAQ
eukprot:3991760-Amphidinium_carterae.1